MVAESRPGLDPVRVLAITGHRPPKLGGFDPADPVRVHVRSVISEWLERLQPQYGLTGMALGVDQDFAMVCIDLGIPFAAALPCDGQDSIWPEPARKLYAEILSRAALVEVVSPGPYARHKMLERNHYMIHVCDRLLAVWDGSDGGTGATVRYAREIGRRIHRIQPKMFGRATKRCEACDGEGSFPHGQDRWVTCVVCAGTSLEPA